MMSCAALFNALIGWAVMLRKGVRPYAQCERACKMNYESARRKAHWIEEVLDVARIVTGKPAAQLRRCSIPVTWLVTRRRVVEYGAGLNEDSRPAGDSDPRIVFVSWSRSCVLSRSWVEPVFERGELQIAGWCCSRAADGCRANSRSRPVAHMVRGTSMCFPVVGVRSVFGRPMA